MSIIERTRNDYKRLGSSGVYEILIGNQPNGSGWQKVVFLIGDSFDAG